MLPFPRKRLIFALVFFCCAVLALAKLGPASKGEIGPVADSNIAAAGPTLTNTATPAGTPPICPTSAYMNPTAITISDNGPASPYPSNIPPSINVSLDGTITSVSVTLLGLNHAFPDDIDIMLVGPGGQNTLLMSDAGGSADIADVNLSFADSAAAVLPDSSQLVSGTYKPTNFDTTTDIFPPPGPIPAATASLSVFNGLSPGGTWSLYVRDDLGNNAGSIVGGWILHISTSCIVPTPTATASPTAVQVSLPNMVRTPGPITIPITVGDTTGSGIISYDLQVSFNPLVVVPASPPFDQAGTLSSSMSITPNTAIPGHFIISAFQGTNLTGSGTLLNLKFNVVGFPGLSTALDLSDYTDPGGNSHPGFLFNEGDPPAAATNGSVTIPGDVTATNTPTPTFTPSNSPTQMLTPSVTPSSPPNSGTPTYTATATATPTDTATPPVPVSLPNLPAPPYASINVPITAGDTTGRGIISYDLQITFDPAVIQPADPPFDKTATLSSGMVVTANAANVGHLIISAFQGSPLVGSGTLLNLRFNVVGYSGQLTTLVFENYTDPGGGTHRAFVWNEGEPPASTTNGRIFVFGNTPTATASPTPTCEFGNFANPAPVTIGDNAAGSPYPSTIAVSGLVGTITKVTVGLTGVSHTFPDDIDIMLVGPDGQGTRLMSDTGGEWDVANLTFTFDDAATPALRDATQLVGGTFKPTNFDTASDVFPAPAPSPEATASLSVFNRLSPNGIWSLYVRDDAGIDIGSISGGWTLQITTTGTLCGDTPTATPTPTSTMTSTPVPTPSETPGGFHYHQFSASTYFEDESQTIAITITRSGDTSVASQVVFSPSNGTGVWSVSGCVAGADYFASTQILLFSPGELTKTVSVQICGDNLTEPDETVNLNLGPDVGAPASAVLKINDTASQFKNSANIAINGGTSSAPYPSTIAVSGAPPTIGSMRITLYDYSCSFPDDTDFLLIGPQGQNIVLLADAGGNAPGGPVTLNFSDTAGAIVPDNGPITTRDFEPTSYGAVAHFAAPAPAGPYHEPGGTIGGTGTQTLLGNFGGTDPNGTWSLYVRNRTLIPNAPLAVIGNVAGGWGIEFLGPTAANASISGRVTTADGFGIRNARVVVTGNSLSSPIVATTGSFGYFAFEGLRPGETYVVTINSRRYTFSAPSRVISLVDNVVDADFVADPEE